MTISSSLSRVVHLTHGDVSQYPFPFKAFKAGHLAVLVIDPETLGQTGLTLGTDYSVTGLDADSGGAVILTPDGQALAKTGRHLVIMRDMPFIQETDFTQQGTLWVETLERSLDLAAQERQQLRDSLGLAIQLPADSNEDSSTVWNDLQVQIKEAENSAKSARQDADRAEEYADTVQDVIEDVARTAQDALAAAQEANGIYTVFDGFYDADLAFKVPDKKYLTNEANINLPSEISAPCFIEVAVNSDGTSAVQWCWQTGAGLFTRMGSIDGTDPDNPVVSWAEWAQSGSGGGGGGGGYNKKQVITESGIYTVPSSGWYKITCIGGGGGGGKGGADALGGFGGLKGGDTYFGDLLTAIGGSGGGGAGHRAGAGGGGSGETVTNYIQLTADEIVHVVVGAGGPGAITANNAVNGLPGEGPFAGKSVNGTVPGFGAAGAGSGATSFNNSSSATIAYHGGIGGNGGCNQYGYGNGGGGGGGPAYNAGYNSPGGVAGPGAEDGFPSTGNAAASVGGNGGNGGNGAIIIEYSTSGSDEGGGDGGGGLEKIGIDYSLTEQDTGLKWIDGKPVYQLTVLNVTAGMTLATGISDVISAEFTVATTSSKDAYGFNNAAGSSNYLLARLAPATGVLTLGSQITFQPGSFVTVRYTKRDD